jgi:Acyl-CoA dehydrogenase N terminal
MGHYIAPLRDMHFVLHELLQVEDELKQLPTHAEVDADIRCWTKRVNLLPQSCFR